MECPGVALKRWDGYTPGVVTSHTHKKATLPNLRITRMQIGLLFGRFSLDEKRKVFIPGSIGISPAENL